MNIDKLNTFENILVEKGFKKIKNFCGVKFYQNNDIFASIDDRNRIVDITNIEGKILFNEYSIRNLINFFNKIN